MKHRKIFYFYNEVIEIFNNKPKVRLLEKGIQKDENIYLAAGQTDNGRYLVIFFIYKKYNNAIVISAREMSKKERKSYVKK
jgi:uncharacterized protein